jgi:hypothetical protein
MKIQRRTLIKATAWTSATLLALTALIGFAHTPTGRPLLALLGVVPGCPVLGNVDPIRAQEKRQIWVAKRAGNERAPARPALGFELGQARQDDVARALTQQGASCATTRKGTALECTRGQDDMIVQFDAAQRLVAVDVFRRSLSGERAVAVLNETESQLAAKLGDATQQRGERTAAYLEGARFRQVTFEYRYSDYTARVAATNFGTELRVREQYDLLEKSGS